jgi:hypothetical protein
MATATATATESNRLTMMEYIDHLIRNGGSFIIPRDVLPEEEDTADPMEGLTAVDDDDEGDDDVQAVEGEDDDDVQAVEGEGEGAAVEESSDLDILMGILEDHQSKMPEGDYLRGMNALGSLHKAKQKTDFTSGIHSGGNWHTHEQICDNDELYDIVMNVAEDIVFELCDGGSLEDDCRLVPHGEEAELFARVVNYRPVEGTAGFGAPPHVLHHALQFISYRLFTDTNDELEIVRPVSCECGWRGVQGNWERHFRNRRHLTWVTMNNITGDTSCDADQADIESVSDAESESVSDAGSDAGSPDAGVTIELLDRIDE